MKKHLITIGALFTAVGILMTGCGSSPRKAPSPSSQASSPALSSQSGSAAAETPSELTVRFGDEGKPFSMHLYDNTTAQAIARYVGTSDWRLPIYHYDDFEHSDVMQYYDISNRYEIPSNAETISSEKAGEVYYSEPNRIVLFYQDAQVPGEYTKVGYFEYSDDFADAVVNNPVVEGWSNKIVVISDGE